LLSNLKELHWQKWNRQCRRRAVLFRRRNALPDRHGRGHGFFLHILLQCGPRALRILLTISLSYRHSLWALLESLRISPAIVPSSSSNSKPELITYSKVRKLISSALYRPLVVFPSLAEALSALEAGDGKPFLQLSPAQQYELALCDSNTGQPAEPFPEIPEMESSADASLAILCSDQAPFLGGVSAFSKYLDECENASKSAGAIMASMRLGCGDWSIRTKWRYASPFKTNISATILFVGNTADNITPLRNAHKSAEGFPGSVVLEQNSYGHTSLSMPSRCTAKTIRAYFQEGRMPEKGTVCEGDLVPFQPWNGTA
jgi:hypothetical protein